VASQPRRRLFDDADPPPSLDTPAPPTPTPPPPPAARGRLFDEPGALGQPAPDPVRQHLTTQAPDRAARVLELNRKTGIPVPYITQNFDALDRRDRGEAYDVEAVRRRAPEVYRWLRANGDAAALAADDLPALIQAEQGIQILGTLRQAWDQVQALTGASLEGFGSWFGARGLEDYGRDVRLRNLQEAAGYSPRLSLTKGEVRDPAALAKWATEGLVSQAPQIGISWGGAIAGAAAGAAIGNVPGAVLGALIGAIPGFTLGYGEVVADIRAVDPEAEIGLGAFLGGSAIAALDTKVPFGIGKRLAGVLGHEVAERVVAKALVQPVRSTWLTGTLKEGVKEMRAEAITEALQKAIADVTTTATTGQAFDAKQTALDMLEEGLLGGLVGGTVAGGVHATVGHRAHERLVAIAEQRQQAMQALAASVAASKVAQRSEQAAGEILAQAGTANGVDTVYLPIETFTEYWQHEGLQPDVVAAELTGNPNALAEARQQELPNLPVPFATFVTKIAGAAEGKHFQFFQNEFRLSPEQQNVRESQAEAAALEREVEALADQSKTVSEADTPAVQIAADVLEKMVSAGESPQLAKTFARYIATREVTRAQARGVDPLELYRSRPFAFTITDTQGRPIVARAATPQAAARANDIPPSRGVEGETREARQTRETAHTEAIVTHVVDAATALDPAVDGALLAEELRYRMRLRAENVAAQREAEDDPRTLLSAIAGYGGIRTDQGGVTDLIDGVRGRTVNGETHYDVNGVKSVVRTDGRTWDDLTRSLMQEGGYAWLQDDLNVLIEAVNVASRPDTAGGTTADDVLPGTQELHEELDVDISEKWWERGLWIGDPSLREHTEDEAPDSVDTGEGSVDDIHFGDELEQRDVVDVMPVPFPRIDTRRAEQLYQAAQSLAQRPTIEQVPVAQLVATQPSVVRAIVEQKRQTTDDGAQTTHPPAIGVRYQGQVYLMDGHHRAAAAWAQGQATTPVYVFEVNAAALAEVEARDAELARGMKSGESPLQQAGIYKDGGEFFQLDERNTPDGFEVLAPHLTPAEQAKLRADTAQALVDRFLEIPRDADWEAVAVAGRAKKGWYGRSTTAIRAMFGMVDSVRFSALLAALSPRTEVETNLANTLRMWKHWLEAGRPTDREAILALLARSMSGQRDEASMLDSWRNNAVTALATEDPLRIVLSGPKVHSFAMNLWGYVHEVTTDSWMVTFAALEEGVLGSGARNVAGTDPGKTPGYLAFSAKVRRVAKTLTRRTGEPWTAANVQETVWSWAKTLYELSEAEGLSAEAFLKSGKLTDEAIASAPDFATLFTADADVRSLLEAAGYGEELRVFARSDARRRRRDSDRAAAGGTGSRGPHRVTPALLRSARRLDEVRQRRRDGAAARKRAQQKAAREKLKAAKARARAKRGEFEQREFWHLGEATRRSASTKAEARAAARTLQGKSLINVPSGRRATLTRDGINKMLDDPKVVERSSTRADHFLAVANIDQLFERAILNPAESAPARQATDNTIVAFHRFYAPLRVRDGFVRLVRITAKEVGPGQQPELGDRLYAIEAIEVERATDPSSFVGTAPAASAEDVAGPATRPDEPVITPDPAPVHGDDHHAPTRQGTAAPRPTSAGSVDSLVEAIRAFNARRGEFEQRERAPRAWPTGAERDALNEELDTLTQQIRDNAGGGVFLEAHISQGGDLSLDSIAVPQSRQNDGIGSAMLEQLLAWADAHNLAVSLDAAPAPRKKGALARFYARHGFITNGSARYYDGAIAGTLVRPSKSERRTGEFSHADTAGGDEGGILRGGFNKYSRTIRLIAGQANLSTFLHESAHLFLEELVEDAVSVPEGHALRADAATALAFIGFTGTLEEFQALEVTDDARRMHETWAEAFVEYLHQGQAPTPELQSLFSKFRSWLVAVYRTLTGRGIDVPEDVRGVMDRLFASEEAIAAAQRERSFKPLFSNAATAGVSELQFAAHQDEMRRASEEAREALQAVVMADWRKTQTADWKAKREGVEREVRGEFNAQPAFVAQSVIRTGKLPDGTDPSFSDGTPIKLSKDAIVQQFGREMLDRLPRPYLYTRAGGSDPAIVATLTGFPDAETLLEALVVTPALNAVIAAETDKRMLERHGTQMLDKFSLADAAKAAVTDQRRKVISAELAMLTKNMAAAAIPNPRVTRLAAQQAVAKTRVRDLHPAQYRAAAARASHQAFEAWGKNDRAGAIAAKRQELFALELARAAFEAVDRGERIERQMRQLDTSSRLRGRLGKAGVLDQIDQVLERYEFRRVSNKDLSRRQSLRAYLEELAQQGVPTDHIPDEVKDDARRIHWRELTVEELDGVGDGVKALVHLGRLKDKLLTAQATRDLEALQGDLATHVEQVGPRPRGVVLEPRRTEEQRNRKRKGWVLGHRTLSSLIFEMDGYSHGPLWQYLMRPLNEALETKAAMMGTATTFFVDHLNTHYTGGEQLSMQALALVPGTGLRLSKMARLMVALNSGNATNKQRMRDGHGWGEPTYTAILESLDARDWDWVEGVWVHIDSYWDETAKKMKRIQGSAADKVEAEPFTVNVGGTPRTLRGGYFPIKFEAASSPIAAAHEDAGVGLLHQNTAYMATTVRRGHEKQRAEGNVSRAVRLDFGVIPEHLNDVIHAIAMHEAIIDVGRILNPRGELAKAIHAVHGDKPLETIRKSLRYIAVGEHQEYKDISGFVNTMRRGSQVVGLGLNFVTPLLQVAGLGNVMARVGPVRTLAAALRVLGGQSRLKQIRAESSFMRTRPQTINREIHEFAQRVGLHQGQFEIGMDAITRKVFRDRVTYAHAQRGFFAMITKMQSLVDAVAYTAARDQALKQGKDEATAIAIGNQVVRDTQASGESAYQAEVLRGDEFQKLFTTFFGPMLATYNLWTEQMHKSRRDVGTGGSKLKASGELAAQFAFLFLVGPAIITLVREGTRGDLGDDDDDERFLFEVGMAMAGTTLFVRDGWQAAGSVFGYEGPPGTRPIATFGDTAKRVVGAWNDEDYMAVLGEAGAGGVSIGGAFLQLPTGAALRAWRSYKAWSEGELEIGLLRAMAFGYDREGYDGE
jgi:GNAT superfamily N-acetyltransferase